MYRTLAEGGQRGVENVHKIVLSFLEEKKLDAYVGFGIPGVLLHFSLSPDPCLMGKNIGKGHQLVQPQCKISDPLLAKANLALMATKSFNLIIASNRELLPPDGTELPCYVPEVVNVGTAFRMAMR